MTIQEQIGEDGRIGEARHRALLEDRISSVSAAALKCRAFETRVFLLERAGQIVETALTSLTVLQDLLGDAKALVEKCGKGESEAERRALAIVYEDFCGQIDLFALDAAYDGTNLLMGDRLEVHLDSESDNTLAIAGEELSAQSLGLVRDRDERAISVYGALERIDHALEKLRTLSSLYESKYNLIQLRVSFMEKLHKSLGQRAKRLSNAETSSDALNDLVRKLEETRAGEDPGAKDEAPKSGPAVAGAASDYGYETEAAFSDGVPQQQNNTATAPEGPASFLQTNGNETARAGDEPGGAFLPAALSLPAEDLATEAAAEPLDVLHFEPPKPAELPCLDFLPPALPPQTRECAAMESADGDEPAELVLKPDWNKAVEVVGTDQQTMPWTDLIATDGEEFPLREVSISSLLKKLREETPHESEGAAEEADGQDPSRDEEQGQMNTPSGFDIEKLEKELEEIMGASKAEPSREKTEEVPSLSVQTPDEEKKPFRFEIVRRLFGGREDADGAAHEDGPEPEQRSAQDQVMDRLNSHCSGIAKILLPQAFERVLDAFSKGESAVFARAILNLPEAFVRTEIQAKWDDSHILRQSMRGYNREFSELVRLSIEEGPGDKDAMLKRWAESDFGKLYWLLYSATPPELRGL